MVKYSDDESELIFSDEESVHSLSDESEVKKKVTKNKSKLKDNKIKKTNKENNINSSSNKKDTKKRKDNPTPAKNDSNKSPRKAKIEKESSTAPITTGTSANSTDITHGPPIATDAAAKKLIMDYLRLQNRPYSAIQIYDNLHHRIPKSNCERVLQSLSQTGCGAICKEYGKAKIYFVDQSTLPSTISEGQMESLRNENEELSKIVNSNNDKERSNKKLLQEILNEPTDDELDRILDDLIVEISQKEERINVLSEGSNSNAASSAVKGMSGLKAAVQAHNFYRKAWHTRKQLCMDAVDMLSEGLGKKVKDLMSEMCLESDQDCGVTLPPLIPEPNQ